MNKDEIGLRVFFAHSQNVGTPEIFIFLFFFLPQKLTRLFLSKEVKPSSDPKIIKLFTFDYLFPPL